MTEKKKTTGSHNTKKKTTHKAKATGSKRTGTSAKNTGSKTKSKARKARTKTKETISAGLTAKEKKRFWKDAMKNVATGADVVVDQVSDYSGQASEVAEKTWGQMKNITSKAFRQSTEFIDEVAVSAYGYAKKYQDNIEIRSLNKEKAKIGAKLGLMLHLETKNKDSIDLTGFMKRKDVSEFLNDLDKIDKKIVSLGKKYDRS